MIHPTRSEAGRWLGEVLTAYRRQRPVVLTFTPGGVRVGYEIAVALDAPLDFVAARRVRIPGHRHSEVGAVTPDSEVLDRKQVDALNIPDAYVRSLLDQERSELGCATRQARGPLPPVALANRMVIVADDGMADALEAEAVIDTVRHAGAARVVYATPGCLPDFASAIQPVVDELVVLAAPKERRPYLVSDERFAQTTTAEVRRLLEACRRGGAARRRRRSVNHAGTN
jgi:putative phosphoribosyl transferase